MIQKAINWLQAHKVVTVVLLLAYFVFIVFMHGPIVLLSNYFQGMLGFAMYNKIIFSVYSIAAVCAATVLIRQIRKHPENRALKLIYLLGTLTLIFIHSRFMFDSNVEAIHSLEFTFLAVLLFALFNRFGAAIMFAVPFMLVDELYQYWVLYPDFNDYFDLNDVSMDTYGCCLAMVTLMIFGVKGEVDVKPLYKRIEFWGLISMLAFFAIAFATCFIAPYEFQKCDNTFLVLNERMAIEPFWREHPLSHVIYHVQRPMEAIASFSTLVFICFGLDSLRNDKLPQPNIPQP